MNPPSFDRRWMMFSNFARLNMGASGGYGPGCKPYQHVLQLLIEHQNEDAESWTIYRNDEDGRKDGKIVFKKWDIKTDWRKIQNLEGKRLLEGWHEDHSIAELQFPVPSRWLKDLSLTLSAVAIPPIAGPIRPFSRQERYKLSLWRSNHESIFMWNEEAPKEWKPLIGFFCSLLKNLRSHAAGEPLVLSNSVEK